MTEKKPRDREAQVSGFKSFIAGGFGGICAVASGHPLDTIKVRLQTQPKPEPGQSLLYTGTWDCARKTVAKEGVRGLYKGMLAPLLSVTPITAICFFGFDVGKRLQMEEPDSALTKPQLFAAGALAGVMTTSIMAPSELVKCRLQVQADTSGAKRYAGPADCARQLYRRGGLRSVYRGTGATLLRDVPATGVYFSAYEWLKELLTPEGRSVQELSAVGILVAGGAAGTVNWAAAVPQDVLKSRLQAAPGATYPRGIRSVFAELVANEGILALCKGATPVLLRAFPANAACFYGYEVAVSMLQRLC